jgi:hypothetical protein
MGRYIIEEYHPVDDGTALEDRYHKRPTVVCLCGSTRFIKAFHEANLRETIAGNIVLSIGINLKDIADRLFIGDLTEEAEEDLERFLDHLHKQKIDLANEILVLNVGGYIGESTRSEIAYATFKHKLIRYLEPISNDKEDVDHV